MKFLVDEAVSWMVAQALEEAGHDAVHVRDVGLSAADDQAVLDRAAAEGRVIVTQGTDFGTILMSAGAPSASVVLLRLRDGRPSIQATLLLQNLASVAEDLREGAIVVLGESRIRVRRLRAS